MLKSLRGSPFCSDSHKVTYQADTERLMLTRLRETLTRYSRVRAEEPQIVYEPCVEAVHVPKRQDMGLSPLTN